MVGPEVFLGLVQLEVLPVGWPGSHLQQPQALIFGLISLALPSLGLQSSLHASSTSDAGILEMMITTPLSLSHSLSFCLFTATHCISFVNVLISKCGLGLGFAVDANRFDEPYDQNTDFISDIVA